MSAILKLVRVSMAACVQFGARQRPYRSLYD